ncbi:cysteinyl-tRNA synthetase [Paraburkholderia sp. MM5482-R2]
MRWQQRTPPISVSWNEIANAGKEAAAQERRREEHQQSLRDDIAQCERDLEVAKSKAVADDLANRLRKLHLALEDRGDRGTEWSLARALEDRIGAYQPVSGDLDSAKQLLKKHAC